MKIKDMFAAGRPVISFEFFPPKTPEGTEALYRTVEALSVCHPSFVSVTYGAGGTTRDRTVELVTRIKKELGVETMAHLTCVGSTAEEIRAVLRRLHDGGIENVLALRGDPPQGQESFERPEGGFGNANELVTFIHEQGLDLCVGAACYPEGHTEAENLDQDLEYLRQKVDCGADFLISQLFFDNGDFHAFMRRARSIGIEVPIVPGLMPVTNVAQVERFTKMCGARIPAELSRRLKIVESDPSAVVGTGLLWTAEQCEDLLGQGVAGVHFYTLNKSSATLAVHATLGL